ncbi:multi antimicrobial extrusion protein [Kipferlia bialata]|uniref:Multi antimicrobial extrusion protein n=1 Tax=Kipferlia bialata TaxID=797122 RepID=A0A9K3GEZ0_9EUKA|nr:multi antimicrobial extrusion protein [Kipferlia bialata]|eukprot:g1035.t1
MGAPEDEGTVDVTWRTIHTASLPAMLQNLIDPLGSSVVTALVGHFSIPDETASDTLAAYAIASSTAQSLVWVFNFLVNGVASRVSKAVKAVKAVKANRAGELASRLRYSYAAAGIGGVCGAVLMALLFPLVCRMASLSDPVAALARPYFYTLVACLPLVLWHKANTGILYGVGSPTVCLVTQCVYTGLYVGWAWVCMQSHLSLTHLALGYGGAYLAAGCVATVHILFRHPLGPVFRGVSPPSDTTEALPLLSEGEGEAEAEAGPEADSESETDPSADAPFSVLSFVRDSRDLLIRSTMLQTVFFVSSLLAGYLGTDALAAYQVTLSLWVLVSNLCDGYANTAMVVGATVPASHPSVMSTLMTRCVAMGVAISALCSVSLAASESWLVSLFTADPGVAAQLQGVWPVLCWSQPINSLIYIFDGFLYATQDFAFIRNALSLGVLCVFAPLVAVFFMLDSPSLSYVFGTKVCVNVWRFSTALYRCVGIPRKARRAEEARKAALV